jgi:alkylation response protein AidB-like acyl-CoA dehydrogenase
VVFEFSDEQRSLREVTRRFLVEVSPESEVRRVMASDLGYDEGVWQQLTQELGFMALVVPEEHGGSGAGMVELAIVLDEMGRSLLCAPFLSSSLATLAIVVSGDDDAAAELLPGLAEGSVLGTIALVADSAVTLPVTATESPSGWVLTGDLQHVLDGASADLVVVAAQTIAGPMPFVVDTSADGVHRSALTPFDRTRRLARLSFASALARPLGGWEGGRDSLARIRDLVSVAIAAECAGGASRVLEQSVAYAKDRVQFGRPIGSFQAIKHLCADTLLDVESARSAAYYAAWAAAEDSEELSLVAPLAHAFTTDTFLEAASTNIQVHGGIAFTWEHPAHLYYRRAKSSRQLFGDSDLHRERLAVGLGL